MKIIHEPESIEEARRRGIFTNLSSPGPRNRVQIFPHLRELFYHQQGYAAPDMNFTTWITCETEEELQRAIHVLLIERVKSPPKRKQP